MRVRCASPSAPSYPYYGGRGIKVCPEWDASFEVFLADMGVKPPGHSLDRIDNDGDYTPENCRWATQSQQNRNTRATRFVTYKGERIALADLADRLGITPAALKHRLSVGWNEDDLARPGLRSKVIAGDAVNTSPER